MFDLSYTDFTTENPEIGSCWCYKDTLIRQDPVGVAENVPGYFVSISSDLTASRPCIIISQ